MATSNTMRDGLVKRGTKWCFVVRVMDPATGKTRPEWHSGFRTRELAKAARDEARAKAGQGTFTPRSVVTVGAWLDEWLEAHSVQLKPSTVVSYRLKIDSYLKPTLGALPVQTLSPTKLSRVFKDLAAHGGHGGAPLSARTVQYTRAILRKSLNDAVTARLIPVNPVTGSKAPFVPKPPQVTWDAAQQRAFLDARQTDRWFPLWALALGTGMRRGEMIALDWAHVDLVKGTVSVEKSALEIGRDLVTSDTKTHEARTVALDATTVEVLRAWRSRQVTERLKAGTAWQDTGSHVFTWPDGTRLLPDYATHAFLAAQRGLTLPRLTLHGCRHSHATALLRAGVPVHVVSKRLGHKNASVTLNTYADAVPHDDTKAVEAFARAVWGA